MYFHHSQMSGQALLVRLFAFWILLCVKSDANLVVTLLGDSIGGRTSSGNYVVDFLCFIAIVFGEILSSAI